MIIGKDSISKPENFVYVVTPIEIYLQIDSTEDFG